MDRRTLLQAASPDFLGARLAPLLHRRGLPRTRRPPPFSFDAVVARAREMAGLPYRRPLMKLTEPFADLKYDQFRAIRFREEKRLFADGRPFQLDLMPPGFTFQDKIEINLVTGGVAEPVAFSTDFFDFQPDFFPYPDGQAPSGLAEDLGFSGVRIRHPINRPGVWDEFAVFQGASYFRAVAHDTIYGLSARGLAIGTGGPDPEEFPIFTAFWISEPQPGDRVLRMSALLDSDSRRRRLRLLARARRRDGDAGPRGALPAPRHRDRRHRAADLDVLLRPRPPRRRSTTSATPCTTATACAWSTAPASGCGGRCGTRPRSRPRPSPTRTRAPSA